MLTVLGSGDLLAERTGGQPARVVALHGWGRTGADFSAILEGLDAVAPHLPGFGITPPPDRAWGSAEYAELVGAALAESGGPVLLVGHSFGGRVAVRLAAGRPELVAGLVLTGVPLLRLRPAPRPSLRFRAVKALASRGVLPEGVLQRLRDRSGSEDYRRAQGVMREILVRVIAEDYREDLARIAAAGTPVRLVWGELDDSAPLDAARAAAALVPGSELVVVPGGGHLLEGGVRDGVRRAVLDLATAVGR